MTILDATNLIYEWFRKNDSFEMNRDLRKVLTIVEDNEEACVAFKIALSDLEKNNLICSRAYGEKTYYILSKSYESYTQNVEINSYTSRWVSEHINDFCSLIEDKTDLCNSTNVSDKDIRNLLHIIQFYKTKTIEKERIIEKLSGVPKDDNDPDAENGKNGEDKKKKK